MDWRYISLISTTGDSHHRRRQERAKEVFTEVDKELGSGGGRDRPSQTQEDGWAQTKYFYIERERASLMPICCRECENQVHRLVLRQNVVPGFEQTQKGAKWLFERQAINAG